MSDIDWSKAPEGATHVNGAGVFQRENNDGSVSEHDEGCWRRTSKRIADFNPNYIKAHPTAWTVDGLPPVGTVCEVHDQRSGSWTKVDSILAHAHTAGRDVALFQIGDYIAFSPADRFRPIRTPEHIAEEERKAAGLELGELYVKGGLIAIYDAGWRPRAKS